MEDTNKALLVLCDSFMKLGELYHKNFNVLHSNYQELLEKTTNINNNCIKNTEDLKDLRNNSQNNNSNNLDSVYNDINVLKSKVSDIADEFENYQKVSIVRNLNDQLHQRDLDLDYLSKRLNKMEKKIKEYSEVESEEIEEEVEVKLEQEIVLEHEIEENQDTEYTDEEVIEVIEDTENEIVEQVEEKIITNVGQEEEEEVAELIEKMLKPKNGTKKIKFYVTDDEEREIYEIMEDNEPGLEPIGKLTGKTNRVKWY